MPLTPIGPVHSAKNRLARFFTSNNHALPAICTHGSAVKWHTEPVAFHFRLTGL
jgi:hypothetical protein